MPRKYVRRQTTRGYDRFSEEELEAVKRANFPGTIDLQNVRGVTLREISTLLNISYATIDGWVRRGEFPEIIGTKRNGRGGAPPGCYPGKILLWIQEALAKMEDGRNLTRRLYLRKSCPTRFRDELQWPPLYTKTGRRILEASKNYQMRPCRTGKHKGEVKGLGAMDRADDLREKEAVMETPEGEIKKALALYRREKIRRKRQKDIRSEKRRAELRAQAKLRRAGR